MREFAPPSALDAIARRVKSESGPILVEGYAAPGDADKQAASLDRANRVREKLVRDGVDPSRVVAVGKGEEAGHAAGRAHRRRPGRRSPPRTPQGATAAQDAALDPIGTSHFESTLAMTRAARHVGDGVDPAHADRGPGRVPLRPREPARQRAVRVQVAAHARIPTDSQLESGPSRSSARAGSSARA